MDKAWLWAVSQNRPGPPGPGSARRLDWLGTAFGLPLICRAWARLLGRGLCQKGYFSSMVQDSKRSPPFIGHGKVNIFLIPLAKMLHFISGVAWPEEVLKSLEVEV